MRNIAVFVLGASVAVCPIHAADELKFAPAPEWVEPLSIPSAAPKRSEAPVAVLLNDEQVRLEPGKATSYTSLALKVQSPDGLSAGNIAFAWQPATDTVTVNKLHIIRDGATIDVLKGGQTFTIARRETNMDAAVLDGTLTANIQPEGLQVGDVISLAMTIERVDPVMKGHVEAVYGAWNGAIVEKARARISWPNNLKLFTRQTEGLPQPKRWSKDGWNGLELSATGVEPLLLPNGAPLRFRIGRTGEATDFQSWSDAAALMEPLYRKAAVIPKSGPLRDEVEKIRQSTKSDKERAEKALQLVEERVRYVALLMGTGGYVPASAEETWARRFGDCKAKTALLVAILRELGIEAEPVLVHSTSGDALPQLLPMISYFDHVIVRAKVAEKTYWLDGTRTGDTRLDAIPTANFRWGLPVVSGAKLVAIVPAPLSAPETRTTIEIDASAGVFAPAPFKIEQTLRGDAARGLNILYSKLSPAQIDQGMRKFWRERYDYVEIKGVNWSFDKDLAELRMSMNGTATLNWRDGWLYVPGSTIAYQPNFDRADGPHREAPFEIGYPAWEKTVVEFRLPEGFTARQKEPPRPISETLAGVEYRRTVTLDGSGLKLEAEERAVAAEVPYKEAIAAKSRLKSLYDDDVYLHVPSGYHLTEADLTGLAARNPVRASEFIWRGNLYLDAAEFDEAIEDFSEAHRLDPKNGWALANRGLARVWRGDSAEAEKDLAAADAIDPGNVVVLRARGLLAERNGDAGAAVELYSNSLEREPGNTWALARRASAYSNLERFDEAIADLDAILAREPHDAGALTLRASAYRELGKNDKALGDTEAALKLASAPPQLRLLRANIFRGQGQHETVVEEAELLIREHPKSDYALVAAGKILSAAGQRDKAMAAFDAALAVKREAYIYVNRAEIRLPDDYDGRLSDLDEALRLQPDLAEALAFKAELLMKQRRFDESIELFDRAIAGNRDDSFQLRARRAVALNKSGRTEEAEAAFAKIRSQVTKSTDFNNLCWRKATAGILLESAVEDCRKALELRPDTPAYLDSLGLALLRLGRLDEAADAYDRAIAKVRSAASFMGRSIVHARKGDIARAMVDRTEALKLDPDVEMRFAEYGIAIPEAQSSFVAR